MMMIELPSLVVAAFFLLVLFFASFVGCTAGVDGPLATMRIQAELTFEGSPEDPWPTIGRVVFRWSVTPDEGERQSGVVPVGEPGDARSEPLPDGRARTRIPFAYDVPNPLHGQWCLSCAYYTIEEEDGRDVSHWWGEDNQSATLMLSEQREVRFHITPDNNSGWQVHRAEGDPCPEEEG